jgi:hypothetical protein
MTPPWPPAMIKPFEAYTWKELMLATPLFGPSITLLGLAFPVARSVED